MTGRRIGLAHLSLLECSPAELVRAAAAAGFDFVGVRVRGATPTEWIEDLRPGSAASRAALDALAETGLEVVDIEFLPLTATTTRDDWLPMLEAGAALGARTMSVAGMDECESRLVGTLGDLARDAAGFGITPTLEPISYNVVRGVEQAARIASAAGAAVLVDPLHVVRGGSSVADVTALDADLVPVLQLCDGPADVPTDVRIDAPLPRGMSADGEPLKVESRALRLPPGEGAFPLVDLIRAVSPGVPVSVEVPNAPLRARLGAVGYARHLREATRGVLALADDAAVVGGGA